MIELFLIQLQFLTRIPVPFKVDFNESKLAKGIVLSPLVGLVIGLILFLLFTLFSFTGKFFISIIVVLIIETAITGGLHLDGLADTYDGIFSNRPRDKILEIMKDPSIGTNGTLALIFTFMLKTGFLFSLQHINIPFYLIVMPVMGRMNMTLSAGLSTYARKKKGLGESIIKNTGIKEAVIAVVISTVITVIFIKTKGIAAAVSGIIFTIVFTKYIFKKLGGSTGDTLGAVVELTEIFFLFSMVVFESIS